MARYEHGDRFLKRLNKLSSTDKKRALRNLKKLGDNEELPGLGLRPMEGHDDLWEMRAGGQNRFILRRTQDNEGDLFMVEDVGPHDVYDRWNRRR